jgi:hypothetical protein
MLERRLCRDSAGMMGRLRMLYGLLASTGLLARQAGREDETIVFGPYMEPMLV